LYIVVSLIVRVFPAYFIPVHILYYILWPLAPLEYKLLIPNMVSEPRSRASTARRNSCFDPKLSLSLISSGLVSAAVLRRSATACGLDRSAASGRIPFLWLHPARPRPVPAPSADRPWLPIPTKADRIPLGPLASSGSSASLPPSTGRRPPAAVLRPSSLTPALSPTSGLCQVPGTGVPQQHRDLDLVDRLTPERE
jgi:hypothetical protein